MVPEAAPTPFVKFHSRCLFQRHTRATSEAMGAVRVHSNLSRTIWSVTRSFILFLW